MFFPTIGKNISTKVSQVGNYINPNNRSFKIRINVDNPKNELKANLLADLKINDFKQNGIVIPTKLIQKNRKGDSYVYTLKKEKECYLVEKTYIVEKMTYSNETFIEDGLLEDALIVEKGARLIKANETVILAE